MILYPAIDILGGRCVRLLRGDYAEATTYGDDPVAQALRFEAEGARWIHLVDLDAARSGEAGNLEVIEAVCTAVDVPVQAGGGVRSVAAADLLAAAGVARVVIGTAAVENPALVADVASRQPVAVGLDARNGRIATHGWTETTEVTVIDAARRFADCGVDALVATDIARDGTMGGPDRDGLENLLANAPLPVIASGGVGTIEDLRSLARLEATAVSAGRRTLDGVIVGRAIYEGSFTVAEAIGALDRVGR